MKKFIGILSISLWAAALVLSPSPASAKVYHSACPDYVTCSQFTAGYQEACGYIFKGSMKTSGLSSCSGSTCSGTENIQVEVRTLPGRLMKTSGCQLCNGGYLFELDQCSTCS